MINRDKSDKGSLYQRSMKCEGINHIVNCLQEVCFRQSSMLQALAYLRFIKEASVEERRREHLRVAGSLMMWGPVILVRP